ncbi:hypothetical protein E3N88_00319 [Mikania micrantha]|uniref:Spt5 KOW domain-containing protein n=1 Tax=Mikania micrantha TaxID=192012 RepID=A0A5N6PYK2_9ASTR|nr:hypothetical protein E3N88_00319 [Mikania micrantha]
MLMIGGVCIVGGDHDGPWFLPGILVNVRRSGEAASLGVIREVLSDGACRVALGASGNGELITASHNEIELVMPRKAEKIVKVDDTLDVKILDMVILANVAHLS